MQGVPACAASKFAKRACRVPLLAQAMRGREARLWELLALFMHLIIFHLASLLQVVNLARTGVVSHFTPSSDLLPNSGREKTYSFPPMARALWTLTVCGALSCGNYKLKVRGY